MDIRKITAAAAKRNLSDIHALQDYFECIRLLCDVDEQEAHRLNKDIRRLSARYAVEQGSADMMELNKRSLLFHAPVELDAFMQYAEWNREPSKRFWLPRRKQLMPVCNSIQDLMDDKLDILAISFPPGTGKSTLEIFLHAWSMGKCPDNPSLASGHSGMLTGSIYDGVLSIISDETEYLWSDVFPEAKSIITNAKEQTIDINKKHRFSSLTCRAIGASLTDATRCEKLLTADDLRSGIEEAMSRERLDKLWTAYTNDLKSNLAIFQSTRPVRGATAVGVKVNVGIHISIHAPREGSDWVPSNNYDRPMTFQSTLPVRGATSKTRSAWSLKRFQSTLPVRGATDRRVHRAEWCGFQSTLPVRGATCHGA